MLIGQTCGNFLNCSFWAGVRSKGLLLGLYFQNFIKICERYRTTTSVKKRSHCFCNFRDTILLTSVPDPQLFGPPGLGSVKQSTNQDPYIHQAKIERKSFVSTVWLLLYGILSLKNDVNLPSKVP